MSDCDEASNSDGASAGVDIGRVTDSDDELFIGYVMRPSTCARVHVSKGLEGIELITPVCSVKDVPIDNGISGVGGRNMLGHARDVCKDCLKKIDSATWKRIKALM